MDTVPGSELREFLLKDLAFQEVVDQTPTTAPPVGTDPLASRWQHVELGDPVVQVVAHHRQPVAADPAQVYREDILQLQELIGQDLSPWLNDDRQNVSVGG
jgi:hypothetical protein